MKKIPIILDGDTGHDDAIAWVMANAIKEFDIKGITTVAGNQTIEKTTLNARRISALIGLDVPVAKGSDIPLLGNLVTAANFHGESGLDGPELPEPIREAEDISAPELMAKILKESDEPVVIVSTGPTTNVASLLLANPELKEKIKCISFMGGGLRTGNWTSCAEFNIVVDPEALDIVFNSGVPIIMSGLDVTEKALCYPEEYEQIRALGNPVAEVVAGWFDFFMKHLRTLGYRGATLHDPCAVLALVRPDIFKFKDLYVEVERCGHYTRGATIPDYYGQKNKKPNVKVAVEINREEFIQVLIDCCRAYNEEGGKI